VSANAKSKDHHSLIFFLGANLSRTVAHVGWPAPPFPAKTFVEVMAASALARKSL
jgi:hypothetical protein